MKYRIQNTTFTYLNKVKLNKNAISYIVLFLQRRNSMTLYQLSNLSYNIIQNQYNISEAKRNEITFYLKKKTRKERRVTTTISVSNFLCKLTLAPFGFLFLIQDSID